MNQILRIKILWAIIFTVSLTQVVAYNERMLEEVYIKGDVLSPQTVLEADLFAAVDPSKDESYKKFTAWLDVAPWYKIGNSMAFFDGLCAIMQDLGNCKSSSREINVNILTTLVDSGLVTREMVEELQMLPRIVRGLNDLDEAVRCANAGLLTVLIKLDLVSVEEVTVELNSGKVFEDFVRELCDLQGYPSKENIALLGTVATVGLVSKEIVEQAHILQKVVGGLIYSDTSTCKSSVDFLNILLVGKVIAREEVILEVKKSEVLELSIRSLSDLKNSRFWDHVNLFSSLIEHGFVEANEVKERLKSLNVLKIMLKNAKSIDIVSRRHSIEVLKILVTLGLITRQEVVQSVEEIYNLQTIEENVIAPDGSICEPNIDFLNTMIGFGLVIKQELARKILKVVVKTMGDSRVGARSHSAKSLATLVDSGSVTKEEAREEIKKKYVVAAIVQSLNDGARSVRSSDVDALTSLIIAGLVSVEEIERPRILETILKGLASSDVSIRQSNLGALDALVASKLITREKIIGSELLKIILKKLSDSDDFIRKSGADTLRILIKSKLITQDDILSGNEEVSNMLSKVYGDEVASLSSIGYYTKFLDLVKDNVAIAYKIALWDRKNLKVLFGLFEHSMEYSVQSLSVAQKISLGLDYEKEIVTSIANIVGEPENFVNRIKEKIRVVMRDKLAKLHIRLFEVASVNAARSIIDVLDMPKENVVVLYDKEIGPHEANKYFRGHNAQSHGRFFDRDTKKLGFIDTGKMAMTFYGESGASIFLPYVPFKFYMPPPVSNEVRETMRDDLKIGDRKVIVLGSPSDEEFTNFMREYNAIYGTLPILNRPVVIVGFRQRRNKDELKLFSSLSGQSIAVRSYTEDRLSDSSLENNNILVLNTSGELSKMYAMADLAIVGSDRNVFEPISQNVAVLYFKGDWQNNFDAIDALVTKKAVKVFNRGNLEALLRLGEQRRQMAIEGSIVLERYIREKIVPEVELFAIQFIRVVPELREKFISSLKTNTMQLSNISVVISNSSAVLTSA